jgi:tetratricopeptide (TPR) repeat protein
VARLAARHGDGSAEIDLAREALAEFIAAEDVDGELAAREALSAIWLSVGGYEEARGHHETALALATRTGRLADMMAAQNALAWHYVRRAELDEAARRLGAVVDLAARAGDEPAGMSATVQLAHVARLDGRYSDAIDLGEQVLDLLTSPAGSAEVAPSPDPALLRRVRETLGIALAKLGHDEAAMALADQLRDGERPGTRVLLIEAHVALCGGDRSRAARLFRQARDPLAGVPDNRDVVEALVGAVASADVRTERQRLLRELELVCAVSAITLLPVERQLIAP